MDDGYGVEAATKLGFDEHQVFKTLMADTGSERVVGVVPVSGHMDLKALAAAVGAKKAAMADPKVAMRESGYVVGGISPLGQRTHHKTVLDESALQYDESCCRAANAVSQSASIPTICSRCSTR